MRAIDHRTTFKSIFVPYRGAVAQRRMAPGRPTLVLARGSPPRPAGFGLV